MAAEQLVGRHALFWGVAFVYGEPVRLLCPYWRGVWQRSAIDARGGIGGSGRTACTDPVARTGAAGRPRNTCEAIGGGDPHDRCNRHVCNRPLNAAFTHPFTPHCAAGQAGCRPLRKTTPTQRAQALGHNLLNDFPVHIRQAIAAALKRIG